MNESDILAETEVNGWRVSTYDDGLLYITEASLAVEIWGQSWQIDRCVSEEQARVNHSAAVSRATRGDLP